jgi:hypothetical protein
LRPGRKVGVFGFTSGYEGTPFAFTHRTGEASGLLSRLLVDLFVGSGSSVIAAGYNMS